MSSLGNVQQVRKNFLDYKNKEITNKIENIYSQKFQELRNIKKEKDAANSQENERIERNIAERNKILEEKCKYFDDKCLDYEKNLQYEKNLFYKTQEETRLKNKQVLDQKKLYLKEVKKENAEKLNETRRAVNERCTQYSKVGQNNISQSETRVDLHKTESKKTEQYFDNDKNVYFFIFIRIVLLIVVVILFYRIWEVWKLSYEKPESKPESFE